MSKHQPGAAPDLQALVIEYGWPNIPAAAWTDYDGKLAEFKMRIRLGINRDVRAIREARIRAA